MSDCAPIVHCPVKEEAAPGGSGPAVPIESGDRFVLPSNCTNQGVADATAMSMSLGAFIGTALENGALCFGSHIFMAFTGDAGPNGGWRGRPLDANEQQREVGGSNLLFANVDLTLEL